MVMGWLGWDTWQVILVWLGRDNSAWTSCAGRGGVWRREEGVTAKVLLSPGCPIMDSQSSGGGTPHLS